MRVLAFPYYTDNPYLSMLYADASHRGAMVIGESALDPAIAHVRSLKTGDVIHLHWTTPICQPHPTARAASAASRRFRGAIRAAQARGVRFIWTVHNLQPHEMPYPRLENRLTRWILRHADDVVVMTPSTPSLLSSQYRVPAAKVRLIPHSSYLGAYPDTVEQADARRRLGVHGDGPVIGFVGEQRPYKGIPELIAAFRALRLLHPDAVLLLGGRVRDEDRAELLKLLSGLTGVIFRGDRIPSEEMQLWFRASDVMVFPYRATLNSGSMFLAATFGRPCVLPAAEGLKRDFSDQAWMRLYDLDRPVDISIVNAVESILAEGSALVEAARAFASARSPKLMSTQMSELLGFDTQTEWSAL